MKHQRIDGLKRNAITSALILELAVMSGWAQAEEGAYFGLCSNGVGIGNNPACTDPHSVATSGLYSNTDLKRALIRQVLFGYRFDKIKAIEFGYADQSKSTNNLNGTASRHRASVSFHRAW